MGVLCDERWVFCMHPVTIDLAVTIGVEQIAEHPESLAWATGMASHVLSGDEVALLSEGDNHALRGKVYAAISPLIDGIRTADDIVATVDGIPAATAHFALLKLQNLGLLVTTGDQVSVAPPIKVVVIGLPELAGKDLCRRVPDVLPRHTSRAAGLTVALTDDYLRPELSAQAAACLAAGRMFLPVRPAGRLIYLGPLLLPGSEPLWRLLIDRIQLNRPADVAALKRGASFPLVPTDTSAGMLDLGLALGGALAARILVGDDPADIEESMLTVDRDSFETVRHPVAHLADPQPHQIPEFGEALVHIELRPARKKFTTDGGHRVTRPEETLARLVRLVSPITGIVSPPIRIPGTNLPVYAAAYATNLQSQPTGPALRSVMVAAGKGASDAQARTSCTAEAVERYSCAFFGDEPRRRARLADIADIAVDPRDLLLFSDLQYAARNVDAVPGFNYVPVPFDPTRAIEWTPMVSLASGQTRWVATAHCFFGYRDPDDLSETFQLADSNGCAAGNTVEEAVLQGLLELVERDAVAIWWYTRATRAEVDLASFADPTFSRLMETYDERGQELHVLDLTVDTGVPVVAAIRWRRCDGGGIDLGFGAHLDPRIAVSRALSELEQSEFDVADVRANISPEIAAWRATATVENQPYLLPSGASMVTRSDLASRQFADLRDEVDWCVSTLGRLGHDVLIYQHTRPDVGFPVVRVVAPGLRHFWKRLAPGRLYDIPVQLGLVPRRLSEDELNPIGMFL